MDYVPIKWFITQMLEKFHSKKIFCRPLWGECSYFQRIQIQFHLGVVLTGSPPDEHGLRTTTSVNRQPENQIEATSTLENSLEENTFI